MITIKKQIKEFTVANGTFIPKGGHYYLLDANDRIRSGDWVYSKLSFTFFEIDLRKPKTDIRHYAKVIGSTNNKIPCLILPEPDQPNPIGVVVEMRFKELLGAIDCGDVNEGPYGGYVLQTTHGRILVLDTWLYAE